MNKFLFFFCCNVVSVNVVGVVDWGDKDFCILCLFINVYGSFIVCNWWGLGVCCCGVMYFFVVCNFKFFIVVLRFVGDVFGLFYRVINFFLLLIVVDGFLNCWFVVVVDY